VKGREICIPWLCVFELRVLSYMVYPRNDKRWMDRFKDPGKYTKMPDPKNVDISRFLSEF